MRVRVLAGLTALLGAVVFIQCVGDDPGAASSSSSSSGGSSSGGSSSGGSSSGGSSSGTSSSGASSSSGDASSDASSSSGGSSSGGSSSGGSSSGGSSSGGSSSGGSSSGGSSSGSVAPCDLNKPFGVASPLSNLINSTTDETYGRISESGLELWYGHATAGQDTSKIYHASRGTNDADLTAGWGSVTAVTEVNVKGNANAPAVTADGKTMFMSIYDVNNSPNQNLYVSTRATTGTAWSAPTILANINAANDTDEAPWISRDGTTLVWFKGPGPYAMFMSVSPFSQATAVSTPAAGAHAPVLTDDGLTMYFSSYTPPASAPTDTASKRRRVWKMTRASTQVPFDQSTAAYVTELDVYFADTDPTWISKDGCSMMVESNRAGTNGGLDLFVAKKPQ